MDISNLDMYQLISFLIGNDLNRKDSFNFFKVFYNQYCRETHCVPRKIVSEKQAKHNMFNSNIIECAGYSVDDNNIVVYDKFLDAIENGQMPKEQIISTAVHEQQHVMQINKFLNKNPKDIYVSLCYDIFYEKNQIDIEYYNLLTNSGKKDDLLLATMLGAQKVNKAGQERYKLLPWEIDARNSSVEFYERIIKRMSMFSGYLTRCKNVLLNEIKTMQKVSREEVNNSAQNKLYFTFNEVSDNSFLNDFKYMSPELKNHIEKYLDYVEKYNEFCENNNIKSANDEYKFLYKTFEKTFFEVDEVAIDD